MPNPKRFREARSLNPGKRLSFAPTPLEKAKDRWWFPPSPVNKTTITSSQSFPTSSVEITTITQEPHPRPGQHLRVSGKVYLIDEVKIEGAQTTVKALSLTTRDPPGVLYKHTIAE